MDWGLVCKGGLKGGESRWVCGQCGCAAFADGMEWGAAFADGVGWALKPQPWLYSELWR